jgi:large subunit ribosomal protein L21
MYAVIETGGKQYRVEVGTQLEVELLDAKAGDTVTLERVLLVADGDAATIGHPVVTEATVSAEVLRQERGEKVISFKYRPKARRRVKKGHRQELHVLRIADIVLNGKSAAEAVKKAQTAAKTERQRLEEAAQRQAAEDAALAAKLAAAKSPKVEAKGAATTATKSAAGKPAKAGAKPAAKTDTKPAAKAGAKPAAPNKPAARPDPKPAAPKSRPTKKDG